MAKPKPLMNPFILIEGEYFVVLDYYDQAEHRLPNELKLQRLNPNEVKKMHQFLNYQEGYALVIPMVRKRLGYTEPHDTNSKERK